MSGYVTISFKPPGPTNNGMRVPGGSDVPNMRPRTGPRGSDKELAKLLSAALEDLAKSTCSFWACKGPSRPIGMTTCVKRYAMRYVATVQASLEAR